MKKVKFNQSINISISISVLSRLYISSAFRFFAAGIFSLFALSALSQPAYSFETPFMSFQIPGEWSCAEKDFTWHCKNSDPSKQLAHVVLAITPDEDQKKMDEYKDSFIEAKTLDPNRFPPELVKGFGSEPKASRIQYFRYKFIQNRSWLDVLHFSSEIPGFATRYLALKSHGFYAIFSLSVPEDRIMDLKESLDMIAGSLKVIEPSKEFIAKLKAESVDSDPRPLLSRRIMKEFSAEQVSNSIDVGDSSEGDEGVGDPDGASAMTIILYLFLGIIVVLVALAFLRRKN